MASFVSWNVKCGTPDAYCSISAPLQSKIHYSRGYAADIMLLARCRASPNAVQWMPEQIDNITFHHRLLHPSRQQFLDSVFSFSKERKNIRISNHPSAIQDAPTGQQHPSKRAPPSAAWPGPSSASPADWCRSRWGRWWCRCHSTHDSRSHSKQLYR